MTYGACFGDIVGAPYEYTGAPEDIDDIVLTSSGFDYTDDSVLTCRLASAMVLLRDADDDSIVSTLSHVYARSAIEYPGAGWGTRFNMWAHGHDHAPYDSYGNGSAMRVSSIAWLFDDVESVLHAAMLSAIPTHNHPEGIRGAKAIALAVFLARHHENKESIRTSLERMLDDGGYHYDLSRTVKDIVDGGYGFQVSCQLSVPEALCAFFDDSSVDYESTIRNTLRLGGDADTQCAMTGAIAEAMWGIPVSFIHDEERRLENAHLSDDMRVFIDGCESYSSSLSINPIL